MCQMLRSMMLRTFIAGSILWLTMANTALHAQNELGRSAPPRNAHYLLNADMPPGALGAMALNQRKPVQGYYQPIEIFAPEGTEVAIAIPGGFAPPSKQPVRAGMMVGGVYRLQLTNMPFHPGVELFPTIEVIDRLYPPPGQALNFPIPVHLDANDIRDAIDGRLVTRVIYLEDPQTALPLADEPNTQRTVDVRPDMDPLLMADRLGRPVAVLRMGSRVPPTQPEQLAAFLMGSPPWLPIIEPEIETAQP